MDIGNRLKIFYESEGLTGRKFALIVEKTPQMINSYVNGKGLPDCKTLIAIKDKFPNLNLDWLISGNGEMLIVHVQLFEQEKFESEQKQLEQEQIIEKLTLQVQQLEKQMKLLTKKIFGHSTPVSVNPTNLSSNLGKTNHQNWRLASA